MNYFIIFIFEIIVLYFLSRGIHRIISSSIYKMIGSKKATVWITSLLFLPGTIIHEFAHFIFSIILFVPAGKFNFTPEFKDDYVKMGSVSIGKTDFLRRFLIGVAPLLFGILTLCLVFLFPIHRLIVNRYLYYFTIGYLVFTISNTMFLSKSDLEGSWKFFLIFLATVVAFYLLDINISISKGSEIIYLINNANRFLLIPIVIDLIFVILNRMMIRLT